MKLGGGSIKTLINNASLVKGDISSVINYGGVNNESEIIHPMNNKQLKLKQITPEIAANVVKDYILPMFENDGKKFIKKKNVRKLL